MLTKLIANEVRIMIPMAVRHLCYGDSLETENDKILERPINFKEYETLASCFIILECCIETLTTENDDDDDQHFIGNLDTHELTSLLTQLKEVIVVVCEYLQDVNRTWNRLISGVQSRKIDTTTPGTSKQDSSDVLQDNLEPMALCALGAIRLVAVWCANEPVALKQDYQLYLLELFVRCLRHEMEQVSLPPASPEAPSMASTSSSTSMAESLSSSLAICEPIVYGANEPSELCDIVLLALHSICMADDETGGHLKKIDGALQVMTTIRSKFRANNKSKQRNKAPREMRYALVDDLIKIVSGGAP